MFKLSGTAFSITALAVGAALAFSACSTTDTSADPAQPESAAPTEAATAPASLPFDVPTVSISYVLDGKEHAVTTELAVSSCSAHAFSAMAVDGTSGSALFPTPEQTERSRITATIFGDQAVAFQGDGTPEYIEDAGVLKAYTVDLEGTATVTSANEGAAAEETDNGDPADPASPDAAYGTPVRATLTAVLECSR